MQRLYIIKNSGAWMMDELTVFARTSKFSLLFLRQQEQFYDDNIKELQELGIKIIYLKPKTEADFSKISFSLLFIIRHFRCFLNLHSFVYGLKSIYYFLKTDLKEFVKEPVNIHSQFATQASILALILKEYYKSTVSYSFTYHAYDIYVRNLWFNILTENAQKVFSISKFNIQYVSEHYNIYDKSKLLYSPLGVFLPLSVSGKGNSKILKIGFLSYFVEMKGIRYLMPAIKKLKESEIPFLLSIGGDGPLKDEMISYVKKNKLEENVKFLGLIKNKDKELFFRNIDLFILPSISIGMETDGLPVVLMEAISYGVPIISTNISGIPEICINNYNGYLIEQRSVDDIVNAIIRFNTESLKWAEFSLNSLEVSRKFDITINSKEKFKMMGWN
jgi:glycosyltransferase involved in cell wall biosynthesis